MLPPTILNGTTELHYSRQTFRASGGFEAFYSTYLSIDGRIAKLACSFESFEDADGKLAALLQPTLF